ncbi:unnamed protein product [Albugo candida]|nr:unnamed protein product [Albugo candida]|eukprot:CCI49665.1 unnamed protein product [Albugo candida]
MLQSGDHANPNVKIYSPSSGLSGPNLPDEKTAATSSFPSSGIAHVVNTVVDASTVDDDRELEAIGSSFTPAMSLLGRDGTMDETRRRASSSVQAEEGLDDKIAESENSDSTDSDDENNNSSSSSDETHAEVRTRSLIIRANAPIRANTLLENKIRPKTLPTVHTDVEPGDRRRLAVCVWEDGIPVKRLMSINELRATILTKVKATSPRRLYRKIARAAAVIVSLVPVCFRVFLQCQEVDCFDYVFDPLEPISLLKLRSISGFQQLEHNLFAQIFIAISCMLATYFMASIMFAALADAEVTYHRRFLCVLSLCNHLCPQFMCSYAKCFTALTSARRSRLSNLPHFRLKNVVNIKAWIALRGGRTWLKRQGRQRAADEIVSSSFLLNLVLLVVMGVQSVSEFSGGLLSQSLIHIEVTVWCSLTSVFMLRFMMLGSRINKKYQNTSLLLTEQMNVYLRLLAKPHKKEKLLVSNNVLKLASKLLKELNSPNKVSGLTMNPLLYNLTRVVVLSAFSSVASEVFGFKLKLWKMKV